MLIYPKSHLNKYKHKKIWDNYSSNFQVTVDEEISLENGEKILPLPIIMNAGDIAIWSLDTVHSSMDNTNLDTLRPFLIFEAQAFKLKLNERGELPFIINGNLRFIERLILKYTIAYKNILNFFYLLITVSLKLSLLKDNISLTEQLYEKLESGELHKENKVMNLKKYPNIVQLFGYKKTVDINNIN